MDSDLSATTHGSAFAEVSAEVAGTAALAGVSDSAGGLAGGLAGRGSGAGVGGRLGSIRFGVGQDTITTGIRQTTQLEIPTTIITDILRRPKAIRALTPTRNRWTKIQHNHSTLEKSRCRSFSI